MSGLPSTDSRSSEALAEHGEASGYEKVLREASRDAKIIFGALRGTFRVTRSQLESFYHLVDQRIREQNHVENNFCEFCFYYNDATSRRFLSFEDWSQYAETRQRFPTVFTIHIVYFIKFPDSSSPEKQEIDISIRSSESTSETIDMVANDSSIRASGDRIQFMIGSDRSNFGVISYNINHSRVSWGLDLESHIRSHVDQLLIPPSFWDKILQRSSGPLNLLTTVFVGLFITTLIIDAFFAYFYRSVPFDNRDEILAASATSLVNGSTAKYLVISLIITGVVFILFSGLISRITTSLRKPKPSFICLNENDDKRCDDKLKRFEKRWAAFLILIASNIVTGLFIAFLSHQVNVAVATAVDWLL